MRGVGLAVICAVLALSAAAHAVDRTPQAALLNAYVSNICAQAGLDASCEGNWSTLVQAGMNDIDLRCDDFLARLNERRRIKIIAETAADKMMRVSGSDPKLLDVVTAAFGIARASDVSRNSRLLISTNHSTLQTIVLDSQRQFREKIKNGVVPDQAAAIDILHGYLQLCMPVTIEAAINASATKLNGRQGTAR
jgi:hypothetical protein